MKTHFEQFGPVVKLLTNVDRGAASVEFETHQAAVNARRLGTKFESHEITITWKKRLSRSSSADNGK